MLKQFQEAVSSGDIQNVISSSIGQIVIAVLALILLVLAITLTTKKEHQGFNVKALTYSAIAIAISFVLSQFKLFSLPQGGSLTPFSMLFIISIGYFFGLRTGVLAGVVYGLLQLAFGGWVMHPIQLLLDYPIAFGALGLSGLFMNQKYGLAYGVLVGCCARFFFHFLSGVIFFGSYTPEGWNILIYSVWYNFSYVGVEGLMTAIIVAVAPVSNAFKRVKQMAL
jgi:thiamine transporter